ncbi:hypothetical protein OG756_06160 [Streptomyces sp. NBC_01310]|uniref:hypothetical protein n=1 Tax=unclassified Streptomyces TaxID=2593676 RepID=UPI0035B5E145|nr:hypothetical protein OG756_06160 [Streptomyces sp. NBC_01310]
MASTSRAGAQIGQQPAHRSAEVGDPNQERPDGLGHTLRGGTQLRLQTDGNLVVYDQAGRAKWAAGTNNKNPGWLVLGTDGSLRLYSAAGQQIWAA